MTKAMAGKLILENQLRQAIDREEFVLHYQPKVSFASGKLVSAEALIRWNDPRTGQVPPSQFIPVLEETGLIYEVGRWALRKAIADYLSWLEKGLPAVRVAVNVSALQLRSVGFIAELEQALAVDARAAAGLELEITESLTMRWRRAWRRRSSRACCACWVATSCRATSSARRCRRNSSRPASWCPGGPASVWFQTETYSSGEDEDDGETVS
ncbi:EAL domain-containing protein [Ectothiorhodospira marina]